MAEPKILIRDIVSTNPPEAGYQPVMLVTNIGEVECLYYQAPKAKKGVIYIGGVGGDYDTPAEGLYPKLCLQLKEQGFSGLRVSYRYPTDLEQSVLDVIAGINFLEHEGIKELGLVGHSFGGAVVIRSASESKLVKTVVTLATQSHGAEAVAKLTSTSILLIHGAEDKVLSPFSSISIFEAARGPKQLMIYKGAGHTLNEIADEIYLVVDNWLISELN